MKLIRKGRFLPGNEGLKEVTVSVLRKKRIRISTVLGTRRELVVTKAKCLHFSQE
jgi:hypothetical protein